MLVRAEWQSTVRDMFSWQMETLRGAQGEQDHPAGEMARYWPQAGLLAWFWSCVSSTWPQYFLGHVVFLSLPYKASNLT